MTAAKKEYKVHKQLLAVALQVWLNFAKAMTLQKGPGEQEINAYTKPLQNCNRRELFGS